MLLNPSVAKNVAEMSSLQQMTSDDDDDDDDNDLYVRGTAVDEFLLDVVQLILLQVLWP